MKLPMLLAAALVLGGCSAAPPRYDLDLVDHPASTFEDARVKIVWQPSAEALGFALTNKTSEPLAITWQDAAYLDAEGRRHPVLPAGVRLTQLRHPLAPTVVPAGATVTNRIYPADAAVQTARAWYEAPLLTEASRPGQIVQVHLPLTVGDYRFRFRVQDAR